MGIRNPNPTSIPAAQDAAKALAASVGGYPFSFLSEVADIPVTAHFLGGCVIGDSPEHGVVDPYHRLYGHPGISVVDGAAVSANLGVNPALTITAQAERAMAMWPNKGEPDPRPAQHQPYRRVPAVPPAHPAVPATAFGALRLPLLPVPAVPPVPGPRPAEPGPVPALIHLSEPTRQAEISYAVFFLKKKKKQMRRI